MKTKNKIEQIKEVMLNAVISLFVGIGIYNLLGITKVTLNSTFFLTIFLLTMIYLESIKKK